MSLPKIIRIIAIFSLCFLAGCSAVRRPPAPAMERYPNEPWRYYLDQAASLEANNEYQRALAYLLMAKSIQPEDPAINQRIEDLNAARKNGAENQFQGGLKAFQKKQMETARHHFLAALAYDHDHSQALSYLRKTVADRQTSAIYTPAKKETAATISEALWKDFELGFLLYYFNEKSSQESFDAGEPVHYPLFSQKLLPRKRVARVNPLKPPTDIDNQLKKAEQYLAAKNYKSALNIVKLVKLYDPDNSSAEKLKDEICFQAGKDLQRQKRYLESRQMLSQVTHGYKGVEKLVAEVNTAMQEQAEAHYRSGVGHFLKEELELAISDWEAALLLNPDHPTARKDLENARKLLEKLKELE